jgi:hypothetical protein
MVIIWKKWKILFHYWLLLIVIDHYSMKWWLDAQKLFWINHKFFNIIVYRISRSVNPNSPLLYWTACLDLFHILCWNHCIEFPDHKLLPLIKKISLNLLMSKTNLKNHYFNFALYIFQNLLIFIWFCLSMSIKCFFIHQFEYLICISFLLWN